MSKWSLNWKGCVAGLLVMLIGCALPASGSNRCDHGQEHFSCVEFVRNYDGDTITFSIPYVHPILGENIKIRVLGIDAPEMTSDKACEVEVAERAQKAVKNLLEDAHRIDLEHAKRGKYFRIVTEVRADETSVADYLLERDLAVPYEGGTKPDVDWCDRL